MAASVLWSAGSGYSVSAIAPGPRPVTILIPPTTPLVGTSASLFVLLTSGSPGSGGSVTTQKALYSATFLATGKTSTLSLTNTIGQDFPNAADPLGYGTYAMFLTDPGVALGGTLTVTVNVGADSLGLSDAGSIAVCVIDHQLPAGSEPWFIALVGGASNLPIGISSAFNVAKQLGPYLCLMTLSMVGASTAQVAATNDITITPNTFLTAAANGTTTSFASYISPYPDLTPFVWPVRPDAPVINPVSGLLGPAPSMLGSWSWTTPTSLYSEMLFWLGPRPAAVQSGPAWTWGQGAFPVPGRASGASSFFGSTGNDVKIIQAGTSLVFLEAEGNVIIQGPNVDGLWGRGNVVQDPSGTHRVDTLPPNIVDIGGGQYSMFALDALGNLWAWGSVGRFLGAGDNLPRYTPFITLTGVSMFGAGPTAAIARLAGTTTYVGVGFGSPNWAPTGLNGLDIVQIRIGRGSTLGSYAVLIMRDGTVWTIGRSGAGQCGFEDGEDSNGHLSSSPLFNGTFYTDQPTKLPWSWANNIIDCAPSFDTATYLRADGTAFTISDDASLAKAGAGLPGPATSYALVGDGTVADGDGDINHPQWRDLIFAGETGKPLDVIMPLGVTIAALYQCAGGLGNLFGDFGGIPMGAVLGSDRRIYTFGETPPGDGTYIGPDGVSRIDSLPPPFIRYGQPVCLNGLSNAKPGGMSVYGYAVWAPVDSSIVAPGAGGGGGFGLTSGFSSRSYGQIVG